MHAKHRHTAMESLKLKLSFLLFGLLLSISSANVTDPCNAQSDGAEISVIPMYGKCSPFKPSKPESPEKSLTTLASGDPQRLQYLWAKKSTPAPIGSGHNLHIGSYVVRVKLGTPGQLLHMVLDTSNDAAWAPCPAAFAPKSSTSFAPVDCSAAQCSQAHGLSCPASGPEPNPAPCRFNRTYGGDSSFSATLSRDSLTLGSDIVSSFTFGCVDMASGASLPPQGLLGLGRGPMSLVSQTGFDVFSYCLPSFKSFYFSGSLKLGRAGQPKNIRTMPLLRNPHRPSLYYVNLTGVSVGKVNAVVPPGLLDFDPTTGAGTVIDSGTVITRFVQPVYEAIRDEFRRQVKGPFSALGAFDTCFEAGGEALAPAITLHFTGLDLKLPMENGLIHSSAGSVACLAMAAAPANVNSVLNVIANLQQQNLRIMFDVANSRVGIARELCN